MKGYDNANGDSRGILERFLPTIFRKSTDGTPTHNAILGAIKQSIETTRDELASMSYEVYFTKATGKFLDLYGKYIGLDRLEIEEDDTYRSRLLSYVKTQRGTISAIVDGIQSELGKDVNVSIYETWRNIFILNKSSLNGLDYIMGKKYRYGVIEITLDTYVDNDVLQGIVNKYKSHGVLVYYKYSLGGTSNVWDLRVDNTENYFLDGDAVLGDKQQVYFKNMKTYLADSPITVKDLKLFKTNTSDLNSSDVLSGNPSNAYIYDKTKSPYFHLIGYVSDNVSVDSYPDVYDYVYKNNTIIPGGRNYVLGSGTPHVVVGNNRVNSAALNYPLSGGETTGTLYTKWGLGAYYTVSYDWSVSGDTLTGTFQNLWNDAPYGLVGQPVISVSPTNMSGHVSFTVKVAPNWSGTSANGMWFRMDNLQGTLTITNFKLEQGAVATPWTPAPEDNDHSMDVYRFGTEPYIKLSKEDNNAYTFAPDAGSSPVFAFNMSRILANNGYNDQVKNFSSNQVTEIGIHTKGSENGLPNTTVMAKGSTGTPISGSFDTSTKNLVVNSEFNPDLSGWIIRGNPTRLSDGPKISVDGFGGSNSVILDTTNGTGVGNVMYTSAAYPVEPSSTLSVSVKLKSSVLGTYPNLGFIYYDSNMVAIAGLRGGVPVTTDYDIFKYTGTIPNTAKYVSFDFLIPDVYNARYVMSQPMMQIGSLVSDYEPGVNTTDDIGGTDYALSNNSSGDYTYRLSTPSQVSTVSLDDYYPYGRSKRVITASGAGTTVPLGIFDTQTTPTMTVPNYATLNRDIITRYVDSVYVNTDVTLSALRIYNFTTQRWESIPAGRFNVGNYLKDSISIPGSYLLIKSTVNTIKYLDIDVTLLNLGVTQ